MKITMNIEMVQRLTCAITIMLAFVFASSCQEDNNTPVQQLPTLTTATVLEITESTATSGGEITDDGGADVSERGVCWSTTANPTVAGSKTVSGSGTGNFESILTLLMPNTTYHVRAYATNNIGTAYGNDVSFTTSAAIVPTIPKLTTTSVSTISQNSAASGGNVTSDGGSVVTARGICWSTSHAPTIGNSKTNDGAGTGSFTSALTALSSKTVYYVRAYAINPIGTAYGNEISFETAAGDTGSTVTDGDGNSYDKVTIGAQIWMTENLKTTKYNDGTFIPLITDSLGWMSDKSGAYTWYHNDVTYKAVYGALYNWYAVNTGKLCPIDWHVSTDDDWTTLENYLIANGYNYDGTSNGDRTNNNKIAKSMADIVSWSHSDDTGSPGNTDFPSKQNASGFNALAGGYKDFYGSFGFFTSNGLWHRYEGLNGAWWTSTEISPGSVGAWWRLIGTYQTSVFRSNNDKYYGLSVRCVKD